MLSDIELISLEWKNQSMTNHTDFLSPLFTSFNCDAKCTAIKYIIKYFMFNVSVGNLTVPENNCSYS